MRVDVGLFNCPADDGAVVRALARDGEHGSIASFERRRHVCFTANYGRITATQRTDRHAYDRLRAERPLRAVRQSATKPSLRKRSANGASPPALTPPMPWAITTAGCGPAPSGRYSQASSSSPEAVGIRTVVRRVTEALFFKFVIAGSYLLSPNRCWGVLWGTSFAGMHIVELAVSDTRLAAAIAQSPLTDGLAAAMMSTLKNGSRIFALALLDRFGSLFGRQPIYIPGHGMPGDLSIGAACVKTQKFGRSRE